jgi:hypothetical protein
VRKFKHADPADIDADIDHHPYHRKFILINICLEPESLRDISEQNMTFTLNKMRDQEQLKLQKLLSFGSEAPVHPPMNKQDDYIDDCDLLNDSHG